MPHSDSLTSLSNSDTMLTSWAISSIMEQRQNVFPPNSSNYPTLARLHLGARPMRIHGYLPIRATEEWLCCRWFRMQYRYQLFSTLRTGLHALLPPTALLSPPWSPRGAVSGSTVVLHSIHQRFIQIIAFARRNYRGEEGTDSEETTNCSSHFDLADRGNRLWRCIRFYVNALVRI